MAPSFDRRAYLIEALRQGAEPCGAMGRSLRVDLETTRDEVVDVLHVSARGTPDAKLEACVTEAAWALDLPSAFSAERESFAIEI